MFNYIISHYNKIKPEESQGSLKSIFSRVKHSTKEYDIIDFYNKVYIPVFSKYIHEDNSEEKSAKKTKTSSPETNYQLQKKLKFDQDSAYNKTEVVYDSVKFTNMGSTNIGKIS